MWVILKASIYALCSPSSICDSHFACESGSLVDLLLNRNVSVSKPTDQRASVFGSINMIVKL